MTDPDRTPQPWRVAQHLPKGSAVIFRAFSAPDAVMVGHKLRHVCNESGALLLVGRDPDLAVAIDADGIHLPQRDLQRAADLGVRHPHWLITGAVHDANAWGQAAQLDAAIVSPVFVAGGTSANKTALGIEGFERLIEQAPCPVYALGGINAGNAQTLLHTRACGLAGVDAVQAAFAQ